jgi:MFS family permease
MPDCSATATSITADPLLPPAAPNSGYRVLLRSRTFGLFFAAFSISTLGTAAVPVALSFALLGTGYSASTVGIVLAAQATPMVLLMLAGGVVGDRWPRRRRMIAADLLRCASQATLATLLAIGHPTLPALMALAACCGVGTAFYGPAESGLIPQVAGAERIKDANSLISLSLFAAVPDGARTWGLIASATGVGGIAGGLLVLHVHIPRPLLAVQLATALLATPSSCLRCMHPCRCWHSGALCSALPSRP